MHPLMLTHEQKCETLELELETRQNQVDTLKQSVATLEKKNAKLRTKLAALNVSETQDGTESICSVSSYLMSTNKIHK